MEEETGAKEDLTGSEEKNQKDEIFTRVVRAGKRTYFFDVKATRKDDYYLTITESKKRLGKEGKVFYEKHKIFLYKEDFDKFTEGLTEAIEYIKENAPELLEAEEIDNNSLEAVEEEEAVEQETPDEEFESKAAEEIEPEESSVEQEVGEPITENFSNVEFEDLDDTKKS